MGRLKVTSSIETKNKVKKSKRGKNKQKKNSAKSSACATNDETYMLPDLSPASEYDYSSDELE